MRGTIGAVAAALAGTTLGAALVLLAGFVYQLVAGEPTGGLAGWAFGLLLLAVVLFGVFGALLPDEDAAVALSDTPVSAVSDTPGAPVSDTPRSAVPDTRGPAVSVPASPGSAVPDTPGSATSDTPGEGVVVAEVKASGKAGGRAAGVAGADDGWRDALVFFLVLFGLVAGGPFGIAGYEALRPEPRTAEAPAREPDGPLVPRVAPDGAAGSVRGGPAPWDPAASVPVRLVL
ncbi:hypothetical protein ACF1BN_06370 [Streptomyces sp. NPDC014861]|uniref:hypothetical protein n=1 Tax=Streptomyces sp. NPDC014861 TaxID=3364923 RepID=UPI0037028A0C